MFQNVIISQCHFNLFNSPMITCYHIVIRLTPSKYYVIILATSYLFTSHHGLRSHNNSSQSKILLPVTMQ